MDFIEGLTKSRGKLSIFIVVDSLTKYGHFMALSHPFSIEVVAQLFLKNVYKLHENLNTITSDRGMIFLSKFWKNLFRLQRVSLQYSMAYHP